MQLDNAVRGESGCTYLSNVSLGGTGLAVKVEADLSSSGEVQLESLCQIVRDGLFGRSKAESVPEGSLSVSLRRIGEAIDGQSGNVVAGAAEDEHVLRRSRCRVFVNGRPALLPVTEALGSGRLDTLFEDEMDLVRSGGGLIRTGILESLELSLLRAGSVGCGQVMDAYRIVLWIDAESDQDVELEFRGPARDGLMALRVDQLEGLMKRDLVGCGLLTGDGARADVHGCVNLWVAASRCHGGCVVDFLGLW